jgi:hypothetical protein
MIEWKDGAICLGAYRQWFLDDDTKPCRLFSNAGVGRFETFEGVLFAHDFQLNEIQIGDYIEKSELDTEQKYNDVVEVFELFGFDEYDCNSGFKLLDGWKGLGVDDSGEVMNVDCGCERKLTYNQVMAIGKLKRMLNDKAKTEKVDAKKAELDTTDSIAVSYLKRCIDVQAERGKQYDSSGTGERSFDAAAKAFNALTGEKLSGSDVCLLLTCVKVVRQNSDKSRLHEDSLLDGVSYLSLWAEELNKELK